jgi:hypothetical protein
MALFTRSIVVFSVAVCARKLLQVFNAGGFGVVFLDIPFTRILAVGPCVLSGCYLHRICHQGFGIYRWL